MITAAGTMIMPNAALAVLMSPIVLSACADLGIAPQTAMMAVAMAASASFASPISHPANILVMGPGGIGSGIISGWGAFDGGGLCDGDGAAAVVVAVDAGIAGCLVGKSRWLGARGARE